MNKFMSAMSKWLASQVSIDTSHPDESSELSQSGNFKKRYDESENKRLSAKQLAAIKAAAESAEAELTLDQIATIVATN